MEASSKIGDNQMLTFILVQGANFKIADLINNPITTPENCFKVKQAIKLGMGLFIYYDDLLK